MESGTGFESGQWQSDLQNIANAVRALAQDSQGDSMALIALLRRLEELHREIRDGIFQASLPNNRQALYALLKDIEVEGGWPYIERMKLQSFLANLPAVSARETCDAVRTSAATNAHVESETGRNCDFRDCSQA